MKNQSGTRLEASYLLSSFVELESEKSSHQSSPAIDSVSYNSRLSVEEACPLVKE